MQNWTRGRGPIAALFAVLALAAGCSETTSSLNSGLSSVKAMVIPGRSHGYSATERERQCLARAIFFEANRSSRDGMIAVGSVVMNRRDSGKWGDDICGVVGAKRQFAPGVLTRKMNSKALPDVMEAADAVLKGERHPKVHKDVMFFHTAGLKFPYKNMHYTTVAGGNAFYFKNSRKQDRLPVEPKFELPEVMVAEAAPVRPEVVEMPATEPVRVAFAGDTPSARKKANGLFGRKKTVPADEMQAAEPSDDIEVALADEAPIPTGRALQPDQAETVDAVFDDAAPDVQTAPTKPTKKKRARATVDAAVANIAYDAPSSERFGGVQPAYSGSADTGLSYGDGMGTGILGQLVIEAD